MIEYLGRLSHEGLPNDFLYRLQGKTALPTMRRWFLGSFEGSKVPREHAGQQAPEEHDTLPPCPFSSTSFVPYDRFWISSPDVACCQLRIMRPSSRNQSAPATPQSLSSKLEPEARMTRMTNP